jgi:hypothetical protein
VIDITPTILEAAGLPQPRAVDGTPQTPIQGVSMVYTFDDPGAKSPHLTQYFEILGNRGIYHDGWLAGTVHRAPWEYVPRGRRDPRLPGPGTGAGQSGSSGFGTRWSWPDMASRLGCPFLSTRSQPQRPNVEPGDSL